MVEERDVIVVGYGPTGLVAASLLGTAGHRVTVLERWPAPYGLPRLTHIDGETARIVQACSDVDRALRDACALDVYDYRSGDGELLLQLDWVGRSCGFPAHISMYQPDIEEAIHERASSCDGVEVHRGWAVDGVAQDRDGVTVSARPWDQDAPPDPSVPARTFRARFAIGADGANSFVREAVGVDRSDYGHNERWLNLDSANKRDLGDRFARTTIFCDPARGHMFMPIGTKRTRFEMRVLPGEETADWETPDAGWAWLERQHGVGPDDLEILRNVVYTFESRIAERWREERVLLAGDAAHTMMPYMGQGACSGMRDGINLAWKLDLVLSGRCDAALLDSYEEERKPHVTAITEMSLFLGQVANEDDPEKAAKRDEAFRTGAIPPMPPFPKVEQGIVHREPDGSILATTGGLAPQGRVRVDDAEGRLDDVVGHGFQLVTRADPMPFLDADAQDFLAELGCHTVVVGDDAQASGGLVELDAELSSYLDTHGIQAYVSRPDFVVFGSVRKLADLDALVRDLREQLHWRHASTDLAAGFPQLGVS